MDNEKPVQEYWDTFLRETGRDPATKWYECFGFGRGEQMANDLLHLVLLGKKTATTSAVPAIEAEGGEMPKVGDLSIVLDGAGVPACVIETAKVAILPFGDVTWEMASREGEDEDLESWRMGHQRFLMKDAEEWGYTFSWDMPVVFEDFEVVYPAQDGE